MTKLYKAIATIDVITDILPGISLIKNIGLLAYKRAKKTDQIVNPNRKSTDFRIYAVSKKTALSVIASIPVLGNIAALILHVKNRSTSFWRNAANLYSNEAQPLVRAYLERNPNITDKELIAAHSVAFNAQQKKRKGDFLDQLIEKIQKPTFQCVREGFVSGDSAIDYLDKYPEITDEELNTLCAIDFDVITLYPDRQFDKDLFTEEKIHSFIASCNENQEINDKWLKRIIFEYNAHLTSDDYDYALSKLSEQSFWEIMERKGYTFQMFRTQPYERLTKNRIDDFKRIFNTQLQLVDFQRDTLEYIIKRRFHDAEDLRDFTLELAQTIFEQNQDAFVEILFTAYDGWLFSFSEKPEGNPFFHMLFDSYYERLSDERKEALKERVKQNINGAMHINDRRARQHFFEIVCEKLNLEIIEAPE